MRARLPVVALLSVLAACGRRSDPGPAQPPKGLGEACGFDPECQAGLVCSGGACAAEYPPSPSCTLPGIGATIVQGSPIEAPEPPAGTCVTPIRDPIADPAQVQALGEHVVGTPLAFEVPPGTSSVTVMSQEVDDSAVARIVYQGFSLPNSVVPTDVLKPGGALFFSDTEPYPVDANGYSDVTGVLAYYGGATPVSGTLTVPNTTAALDAVRAQGSLPAGTWSLIVNDWAMECTTLDGCSGGSASGTYRLHVVADPRPPASTGTLDLEVYLATDPTGPLPTAAAAVASPRIQRFVQSLSAYFSRAGLCLGVVTFHDLPAWARDLYAPGGTVDVSGAALGVPDAPPGCDDLSQLFTVGVAPSQAVHLFLADALTDPSGPGGATSVLGIDGSIPGPSGFPGTVNGGAVMGLFDLLDYEATPGACELPGGPRLSCGPDLLAYVAAHEAGHWLGLYHTTEALGITFDPLADTGTCPCARCAPFAQRPRCAERNPPGTPTSVLSSYCAAPDPEPCSGARNLMFWLLDPSFSAGEITRQQGEVVRFNPAVH